MLKCLKAQPKDLTSSQPDRSFLVVSSIVIAWTNTHVHSGMCPLSSRDVPLTSWRLRCLQGPSRSSCAQPVLFQRPLRSQWMVPPPLQTRKSETWVDPSVPTFGQFYFLIISESLHAHHYYHTSSNYMTFVVCIFKILGYYKNLQSGPPLSTSDPSQSTLFLSTGLSKMQTNRQVILLLQTLCWLSLAFRIKTELPNMAQPPCVAWPYHLLSSSASYHHQRPSHTLPSP